MELLSFWKCIQDIYNLKEQHRAADGDVSNVWSTKQMLSIQANELSPCSRAIEIGFGKDIDLRRDLKNNQHMNKWRVTERAFQVQLSNHFTCKVCPVWLGICKVITKHKLHIVWFFVLNNLWLLVLKGLFNLVKKP